jgi:hypothetical protein
MSRPSIPSEFPDRTFCGKVIAAEKAGFGTVTAFRYELLGQDGSRRAVIGTNDAGLVGLCIGDLENDNAGRIELLIEKDGPSVLLATEGHYRIKITVNEAGPSIALLDERGKARLGFTLDDEHNRLIATAFDERGHQTSFVRRTHEPVESAHLERVLGPLVKSRKKKAFILALGDTFGIYDRAVAEKIWRAVRSGEPSTVTPEDTLREAGVSNRRQAKYQRRMSTLLAGRAAPSDARATTRRRAEATR